MADKRPPGRKPLHDVPASARISVAVTPAQRLELRRVASDSRSGVSGLIREAVNEYVSDYGERRLFRSEKRTR
jgi:hypothetical protein